MNMQQLPDAVCSSAAQVHQRPATMACLLPADDMEPWMTVSMHTKHAHGFQNTVTEIQQINRITEVCSKIFHKCTNMI